MGSVGENYFENSYKIPDGKIKLVGGYHTK